MMRNANNKKINHLQDLQAGFTCRPAKLSDAKELEELFNLISIKIEGVQDFSINEIENDLQQPGFDINKDSLLICNPEGKIVAYQDMITHNPVPVRPTVWGRVHPDYMGMGFGTSLFKWGIERAKSVLERVPDNSRVSIRTWNNVNWLPGKEMLENLGLEIVRHYFEMEIQMTSAPPLPVWPEGIEISTFKYPDQAKLVYRAFDEAFEDHFGHVSDNTEEGFKIFEHTEIKEEGFDPELWFLALDGDEIAGFSFCRKWGFENKKEGHIGTLGVRRPWRKQGLGLALLQHSFYEYWKRGKKRVTLGVDASSLTGAVRLYQRAGMHKFKQNDLYQLELRPGREIARTE